MKASSTARYIVDGPYDDTYHRKDLISLLGIAVLTLNIAVTVVQERGNDYRDNPSGSTGIYLTVIAIRIASAVIVSRLAAKQNRTAFWYGFLGFVAPGIMLIIIGQLKKLRTPIVVDTTYPPDQQHKELIEVGTRYIRRKKFREAADVYQYIIDNLPHEPKDSSMLVALKEKIAIPS